MAKGKEKKRRMLPCIIAYKMEWSAVHMEGFGAHKEKRAW
jgi:hypothetical protein